MFLSNKYTNWYNKIISNAQDRKIDGYIENHHILPKSLGGTNEDNNLVSLTAREHFICHLLLTKMVNGQDKYKMIHAAMFMANHPIQRKISSRTYEYLRKESAIAQQNKIITDEFRQKMSNIISGRKLSEEHKEKIGNIHRGKMESEETRLRKSTAQTGRIHSEESKRKMSEAHQGRESKPHSEETKKRMSASSRHISPTEEHKQKLREMRLGKSLGEETKEKMSLAKKGKPSGRKGIFTHSDITRQKMSNSLKGREVWNKGLRTHRWVTNDEITLYTDNYESLINQDYRFGRKSWKR